ncbi:MAG TPA: type II toxin-antitoxin system RelE/ParE family toxin, partial [Alphaproteobacteria bacterium]|nr:type II toxin-antitoxin system RelE/ParE family toxin [Alphaproteobacteria bacterium]
QPGGCGSLPERPSRSLARIAEHPEIGALRPFDHHALQGVRMWPVRDFGHYLIFYAVNYDADVKVVRILHASRDIEAALEDPDEEP